MAGLAAWVIAAAILYGPVLAKLAGDWAHDSNYSHGFVVMPIAAWLAWRERDRLRGADRAPSAAGAWLVAAGLLLFLIGTVGAELFLTRVSLVVVIAGTVLFVYGPRHLRIAGFPVLFLLFMIPPPAIVFNNAAVSLQLVASQLGEGMLQAAGVAVLRDGNVLTLSNITLQVTEACSGIHSIVSLVTVTTLFAYLAERKMWRRLMLASCAVPLAILLNALRIASAGIAAVHLGPYAAEGTMHLASGWAIFIVGLACVKAVQWV